MSREELVKFFSAAAAVFQSVSDKALAVWDAFIAWSNQSDDNKKAGQLGFMRWIFPDISSNRDKYKKDKRYKAMEYVAECAREQIQADALKKIASTKTKKEKENFRKGPRTPSSGGRRTRQSQS